MGRFRGILLDFYGTLVHEDDEIIPFICETIRQQSRGTATVEGIARLWWSVFSSLCRQSYGPAFLCQRDAAIKSLEETARHFGTDLDPVELVAPQLAHWVAPPIFSDARPFLNSVSERDIPVCIVSNIDRIDLEQAIALHDLHFEHIVTSDDVRAYKPRPEMFEAALAKLRLARDEVLHIGDSRTSDVAGARNVGIPVAWINRSGKVAAGDILPDISVSDLEELRTILSI